MASSCPTFCRTVSIHVDSMGTFVNFLLMKNIEKPINLPDQECIFIGIVAGRNHIKFAVIETTFIYIFFPITTLISLSVRLFTICRKSMWHLESSLIFNLSKQWNISCFYSIDSFYL